MKATQKKNDPKHKATDREPTSTRLGAPDPNIQCNPNLYSRGHTERTGEGVCVCVCVCVCPNEQENILVGHSHSAHTRTRTAKKRETNKHRTSHQADKTHKRRQRHSRSLRSHIRKRQINKRAPNITGRATCRMHERPRSQNKNRLQGIKA
jgi:hypothetical protein